MAYDGTDLTVKLRKDNSGAPSEGQWSSTGVCFTSDAIDGGGGLMGFRAWAGQDRVTDLDDLTLKIDTNADGVYDSVEHIEDFTVDGPG